MRRSVVILGIVLSLLIPGLTAANDETGAWFPFSFPAKLDPNSPYNIGKLVLDPPAGKRGFVKTRDKHFYFDDGTRARFWGTNLCFNACFPDKRKARILAERIAYFGFNAVRLHHMDFHFEPRGIFEDTSPAFKNPQLKKTGNLSRKQFDRLDYLIYQLKKRGVYTNINLLVARHFTEADGVKDAAVLGMAAKPASLFDARLIELQKQYARDLLTHYNPYTKLRYCDDPAVAFVEITNENSLAETSIQSLPEKYRNDLNARFDQWLSAKYGSLEQAQASFESGPNLLPPVSAPPDDGRLTWSTEQHNGAHLIRSDDGDSAAFTIQKVTGTSWHLQFRCNPLQLKKDTGYLLRFTARADREMKLGAGVQQAQSPWENLGLAGDVTLGTEFKTYEFAFKAREDCDNAKAGFFIGSSLGTIIIKDIYLGESNKAADTAAFLAETEKTYLASMKEFLKSEIGIQCPIGIGGHWNKDQLRIQQETLDYVDTHAYWDHPRFPHKSWDKNDFRIHNKSLLRDPNLGFINNLITAASSLRGGSPQPAPSASSVRENSQPSPSASSLRGGLAGQRPAVPTKQSHPFTVSEWNHCYPNDYAYETPLLLAATAAKYDWDALFQFDFSGGWRVEIPLNDIQTYFDIIANPQQLILCSLAGYLYLSGTPIEYTVSEDILTITSPTMRAVIGENLTEQALNRVIANPIISPVIARPPHSASLRAPVGGEAILRPNQPLSGALILFANGKPLADANALTIFAVGKVKNAGSGWNNGRFNWGTAGTKLRKIDVYVKTEKNYRILP